MAAGGEELKDQTAHLASRECLTLEVVGEFWPGKVKDVHCEFGVWQGWM